MIGYWYQEAPNGNCFTGATNDHKELARMMREAYRFAMFRLPDDDAHNDEGGLNYDHPSVDEFLKFTDELVKTG